MELLCYELGRGKSAWRQPTGMWNLAYALLLLLALGAKPVSPQRLLSAARKGLDCDGIEGSAKRIDKCGICGGDNFSCKVVSGLFTRDGTGHGYVDIADIPKGAININITELDLSRNYLALRCKESQKPIINGDWTLGWSADYPAAGTIFTYSRPREGAGETIVAKGPLTEDVQLSMLAQAKNPGISYEYSIPILELYANFPVSDDNAARLLLNVAAGALSVPADQNAQKDSSSEKSLGSVAVAYGPRKLESGNPVFVADRQPYVAYDKKVGHANGSPLLSGGDNYWQSQSRQSLGMDSGPSYQWRITGAMTPCSVTCGEGTLEAKIECVKTSSLAIVAEDNCANYVRPEVERLTCIMPQCQPRWESGAWSSCSASCGRGTQTRAVECRRQLSASYSAAVSPTVCEARKPSAVQTCRADPCYSWRVGNWTGCSSNCGLGEKTRVVICEDLSGGSVGDSSCQLPRPHSKEACHSTCERSWFGSEWTDNQCSADCSEGYLTRRVFCPDGSNALSFSSDDSSESASSMCDESSKPDTQRACKSSSMCYIGKWFAGQWGECAGTCSGGEQARDVFCMKKRGYWYSSTYESDCSAVLKPDTRRKCRPTVCNADAGEWFTTEFSVCSVTCGSGSRRREVRCIGHNYEETSHCDESKRPLEMQKCDTAPCSNNVTSDLVCRDKHVGCKVAVENNLCTMPYYTNLCCRSCSRRV